MNSSPEKKQPEQPRLIVLSAPSGGGKTTLCNLLIKDFKNVGLSISCTTRPKRPYEEHGKHYWFLSKEEFEFKNAKGDFVETATVHGNLYGTPKSEIDLRLKEGKHVLFDIDVQGAMSLQKAYEDRALLVFIQPPSIAELERRIRDRKGDSPESIETRLRNAYNELGWATRFHYQILNDEINRAYEELKTILSRECRALG